MTCFVVNVQPKKPLRFFILKLQPKKKGVGAVVFLFAFEKG